jgi:hypothetical protein
MVDEDGVVVLIDPNEMNRSINRFVVYEIIARINQNEVSGNIKEFVGSNVQIWKFQTTIIFRSKELLYIVEAQIK